MTIQANADEVIGRKGVSHSHHEFGQSLMQTQERGVFLIPTTQAILVAEVSFEANAQFWRV